MGSCTELGTRSIANLRIDDCSSKPTKKHKDASGEAISHSRQRLGNLSLAPADPQHALAGKGVCLSKTSPDAQQGTGAVGSSSNKASDGAVAVLSPSQGSNTRKRQQVHSPTMSASSAVNVERQTSSDSGTVPLNGSEENTVGSGATQVCSPPTPLDAVRVHAAPPKLPAASAAARSTSCPSSTTGTGASAGGAALDISLRLGSLLLSRGRVAEALGTAEEVLAKEVDQPAGLCLKGKCMAALGNNAAAYACFALALAADPLHADTHAACGVLYKACGDLDEACASYKRAATIRKDDPGLAVQLATVLTDQGTKLKGSDRTAEAIAHYQEALATCPTYAPAVYNQGVVAAEAGRDDEAMDLYRRSVELQPRYAEALCNMGVIHKKQGRLEDAIACYEKSLAAAPNFAIVQSNLAIALTELGTKVKMEGRLEEGIRFYERALAVQPKHSDALYNLGVAFGETRQFDKSIFMYEAALWFNPQGAEAWNNLGVVHKELGNLDKAEQCYTAALNVRPHFPQGLNNLAVIYTAQGRAREAFSLLQAALMAAPGYAEAHNNLGVLQRDLGQISEAIASYEKCLELCSTARNAGRAMCSATCMLACRSPTPRPTA